MELASLNSDMALACEIKHDDKLTDEDGVYIQVWFSLVYHCPKYFSLFDLNQAALLYTSCSGQRRLRICNMSLNGEYFSSFPRNMQFSGFNISRFSHLYIFSVWQHGRAVPQLWPGYCCQFPCKTGALNLSPKESRTHLELFRMCRSWRRRTPRQWGRSWCSSAPPYSPATGGTKLWWSSKLMEISGKTARAPAALANWSCRSAWSCCPSTPTASWRATHSRAAGGPAAPFTNVEMILLQEHINE